MSSTNTPTQVLSYVEYLDAIIKYTAYHTTSATYAGFMKYLNKYSKSYPNILSRLQEFKGDIKGSVSYKQPKLYEMKLSDMPASKYKNIISGYTTNINTEGTRTLDMRNTFSVRTNSNGDIIEVNHHDISPDETVYGKYVRGA
jgi:hypothetical protein